MRRFVFFDNPHNIVYGGIYQFFSMQALLVKTMPKIALLGWGSLLWDKHADFDAHHGSWLGDGPTLKIEFTRVSETRQGALTLVIDPEHGSDCTVSYAMSSRNDLDDAICDLRCREGTTLKNIGFCYADGSKSSSSNKETLDAVTKWAVAKDIDSVVWTDLLSNFKQKTGKDFTNEAAVAHLSSLGPAAKAGAAEYVWRAPIFVKTPLRSTLEGVPWFKQ